jgi:glycosyltransferase involved in cell wall biosynthesis
MISPDLVSCLMVTQASRWRDGTPFGLLSYVAQSHRNRELVMVTCDPCNAMYNFMLAVGSEAGVSCSIVCEPEGSTLGQLREAGVREAAGAFVATWDDDDYSHPDRIARQLAILQALPCADAVALCRVTIRDQIRRREFTSPVHPWEMTMVARREVMPPYRADLRVGEDTDLIMRLRGQLALLDAPDLYAHVVHPGATVATKLAEDWWRDRTAREWGGVR